MSGGATLGRCIAWLARPFETSAPVERTSRVLLLARVCTGAVLLHQTIDSLGFVPLLGPRALEVGNRLLISMAASALLTAGLFTPLAIGWLLFAYALSPATGNLGNQITVILLWGLLLSNAGRHGGLDGWLGRRWPGVGRWLFALGIGSPAGRPLAAVRFGLLTLYWGVCLIAMLWHLKDDHWWKAQVLPMALTGPFFSDFANPIRWSAEHLPQLFGLVCSVGLVVQVAWEVFLLPLMYCSPGRWFVRVQGVGFFLASLVLFNLQYLPVVELCLWLLLFGDRWFPERDAARDEQPIGTPATAFGVACVVAVAGFFVVIAVDPVRFRQRPTLSSNHLVAVLNLFGQRPVSVFNHDDLMDVNLAYMVIHETDEAGRHLRVVPYFDEDGRRLRYMRNDLLYFGRAVAWHRTPEAGKFVGGDASQPTPFSTHIARTVAGLDARLQDYRGVRHYRVEVYRREFHDDVNPVRWGKARHVATWPLAVRAEDLNTSPEWTWPAYDLPPGHWNGDSRESDTHRRLLTRVGVAFEPRGK